MCFLINKKNVVAEKLGRRQRPEAWTGTEPEPGSKERATWWGHVVGKVA